MSLKSDSTTSRNCCLERKERFDRFNMSRLQRVGPREISVVPRLGEIHELDQGIGDLVHRRDNTAFFLPSSARMMAATWR